MLRVITCLWVTIWLNKPNKIPVYGSKSRTVLLDRHTHTYFVHTYGSFRRSSCILSALNKTIPDFTQCPEHSSTEYGNYSGREGISVCSRLKNNSRFTRHKVKCTSLSGFQQETTEARQCLHLFGKTQENIMNLQDSQLFCPATCHTRAICILKIQKLSVCERIRLLSRNYSGFFFF